MGREIWEATVSHSGLNKFRIIRGSSKYEVEQKALMLKLEWEEQWDKKQQRELAARNIEENKQLALTMTQEAADALAEVTETLARGLTAISSWKQDYYPISPPQKEKIIKEKIEEIPREPIDTDEKYKPKLGILDHIFSSRKKGKIEAVKSLFESDYKQWESNKDRIIKENSERDNRYKEAAAQADEEHKKAIAEWETQKELYRSGDETAVIEVLHEALTKSKYPSFFPQEFEIAYRKTSKMAVIDYILPCPEHLPTLKEVKFIQSRNEQKETHIPESTRNKMYDDLVYQVALRSIYEIFKAETAGNVDYVVFNGWINSIDKATGQDFIACIASIQAGRNDFLAINLANVDAKACFKKLKGVSSSQLHSLTPIPPLVQFNQDDPRFISSYGVAEKLDSSVNLAAMDWTDFEHLIREVFEKEFSGGGNVKITRASRDGGVDAVAFDPDPIRGGKIVIQAKRYTNTVDVSAVRDLYGTVVNEGANVGILVTTSEYGPDAYAFAKDKPLRLLDGSNLLHLLAKHGHSARIDLKEAKFIQSEQKLVR